MINLRKIDRWIQRWDGYISLNIGIVTLIAGMILSLIEFHNFDISQNLSRLDLMINNYQLENGLPEKDLFVETTLDGERIEVKELGKEYRGGLQQALKGMLLNIIGMFLIGYGVRDYLRLIRGEKG